MQQRWYVIGTKPREESRCVRELAVRGIDTLCPMTREYRFRRRQYEAVPIFPGYIFGHFSYTQQYHHVKWTPGVSRLIQFGETPTWIDDESIELFRSTMDKDGIIDHDTALKAGDPVLFRYGPLKGLVGTVLRTESAKERVVVLMEHLSYQATLAVDRYQVQTI